MDFDRLKKEMDYEKNGGAFEEISSDMTNIKEMQFDQRKSYLENLNSDHVEHIMQSDYAYKDEQYMTEHNELRTQISGLNESRRYRDDSHTMRAVKYAMLDLSKAFAMPLVRKGYSFSIKRKEHIKSFMSQRYQQVIEACDEYLTTHEHKGRYGLGPARKAYVQNIKRLCLQEQSAFADALEMTADEIFEGNAQKISGFTLEDVLRNARSVTINGESLSGGNNSTVFSTTLNGEKKVVKLAEDEDKEGMLSFIEKTNERKKAAKEEGAEVWERLNDSVKALIQKAMKSEEFNDVENVETILREAFSALLVNYYARSNPSSVISEATPKLRKPFDDVLKKYNVDVLDYYDAVDEFIDKLGVDIEEVRQIHREAAGKFEENKNSIGIKRTNFIAADAPLSYRNVATCRISALLGFDSKLVTKSNICKLKGGEHDGSTVILMDMAKGVSLGKYLDGIDEELANIDNLYSGPGFEKIRKEKKEALRPKITTKALQQLIQLQLLDQLCGQCDRHAGNLHIQTDDSGKIIGVTGIDSDMSFGKVTGELMKKGYNRLQSLFSNKEFIYKFLDEKTYNNLMALEPEMLDFFLADCKLDKKEKECLRDRLDMLKAELKKAKDAGKLTLLEDFSEVSQKIGKDSKDPMTDIVGSSFNKMNGHNSPSFMKDLSFYKVIIED